MESFFYTKQLISLDRIILSECQFCLIKSLSCLSCHTNISLFSLMLILVMWVYNVFCLSVCMFAYLWMCVCVGVCVCKNVSCLVITYPRRRGRGSLGTPTSALPWPSALTSAFSGWWSLSAVGCAVFGPHLEVHNVDPHQLWMLLFFFLEAAKEYFKYS